MACYVIRLSLDAECGACGAIVEPGYALATDEIEDPVLVIVCRGCEGGLDGAKRAAGLARRIGATTRQ